MQICIDQQQEAIKAQAARLKILHTQRDRAVELLRALDDYALLLVDPPSDSWAGKVRALLAEIDGAKGGE